MARYQARLFGTAIGPWRGHRDLAQQDAVAAGEASRDRRSGQIYSGIGVEIAEEPGAEPVHPTERRWIDALALVRIHGSRATEHAAHMVARAKAAGDQTRLLHWREMSREIARFRDDPHRRPQSRR